MPTLCRSYADLMPPKIGDNSPKTVQNRRFSRLWRAYAESYAKFIGLCEYDLCQPYLPYYANLILSRLVPLYANSIPPKILVDKEFVLDLMLDIEKSLFHEVKS